MRSIFSALFGTQWILRRNPSYLDLKGLNSMERINSSMFSVLCTSRWLTMPCYDRDMNGFPDIAEQDAKDGVCDLQLVTAIESGRTNPVWWGSVRPARGKLLFLRKTAHGNTETDAVPGLLRCREGNRMKRADAQNPHRYIESGD